MDRITRQQRSKVMGAVPRFRSKPELRVKEVLRGLGIKFRGPQRNLPGKPDIILLGRKTAIFVHGCFWHRHACRRGKSTPASNSAFWISKFARNKIRDKAAIQSLIARGWTVIIIWECWSDNPARFAQRVAALVAAAGCHRGRRVPLVAAVCYQCGSDPNSI